MDNSSGLVVARLICGERRAGKSLLFCGAPLTELSAAAQDFCAWLFCARAADEPACGVCPQCVLVQKQQHPDLLWIVPGGSGSLIKIEQIRRLKEQIGLKPYQARCKVAVLAGAERMKAEAANALLKLLEEPPADAVLVVAAESSRQLLPTIVSRCQQVRFVSGADTVVDEAVDQAVVRIAAAAGEHDLLCEVYQDLIRWERSQLEELTGELAWVFRDMAVSDVAAELHPVSRQPAEEVRRWNQSFMPGSAVYLCEQAVAAQQAIRGNCNMKMTVDGLLREIAGRKITGE